MGIRSLTIAAQLSRARKQAEVVLKIVNNGSRGYAPHLC
jgi:hypothetical protein